MTWLVVHIDMALEPDQKSEVDLFDKLEQWKNDRPWTSCPKVKVVIVGCEGAGKTTLAHSLTDAKLPESSATLKAERIVTKIGDVELTVCDTPPLEMDPDCPAVADQCLKKISRATFMGRLECSAWIYTINMGEKNRFEENDENVELMKTISSEQHFGESVWRNAIIVLTHADRFIKLHKEGGTHPEDNVKAILDAKVKEWADQLHDFLENNVNLRREISQKIPVIAAGITVDDEFEPGMSWINNIWLSLLLVIIEIALRLLFRGPILNGKYLVSFLTNHRHIYERRALNFDFDLCIERKRLVSYACSFLHSRELMLQYSPAIHHANLTLCHSDENDRLLENWRKMSHIVNIVVFGGDVSGKTALINSLFYGKEFLKEDVSTTELSWQTIAQKELTCRVCDTAGLDGQNCAAIQDEIDLVFFCIRITDDEDLIKNSIKSVKDAFGIDIWSRAVVVLTYANTLEPWLDYTAEVDKISKSVKGILRELAIAHSIPIVPSGYHKDMHIRGDPMQNNVWFIALWKKAISAAPIQHQPMLITWLNNNSRLHKYWNKLSKQGQLASCYKRMLIELLCAME